MHPWTPLCILLWPFRISRPYQTKTIFTTPPWPRSRALELSTFLLDMSWKNYGGLWVHVRTGRARLTPVSTLSMDLLSHEEKSRAYDEDPVLFEWIQESEDMERRDVLRTRFYERQKKLHDWPDRNESSVTSH